MTLSGALLDIVQNSWSDLYKALTLWSSIELRSHEANKKK